MSDDCQKCVTNIRKIDHPCEDHARCMRKSGKGYKGGLKWHPDPCDICTRWLAGSQRGDDDSTSALLKVLKLARHHRVRSGFRNEESNDLFESGTLRNTFAHLLATVATSDVSASTTPVARSSSRQRSLSLSIRQASPGE